MTKRQDTDKNRFLKLKYKKLPESQIPIIKTFAFWVFLTLNGSYHTTEVKKKMLLSKKESTKSDFYQ